MTSNSGQRTRLCSLPGELHLLMLDQCGLLLDLVLLLSKLVLLVLMEALHKLLLLVRVHCLGNHICRHLLVLLLLDRFRLQLAEVNGGALFLWLQIVVHKFEFIIF